MITVYRSSDREMVALEEFTQGCWISLVKPTDDEVETARAALGIDSESDFLRAALDEEETSRVEIEDGQTLLIIDVPSAERGDNTTIYSTIPLGIVTTERGFATVSIRETTPVRELASGQIRANTAYKTQFVFTLLLRVAIRYLQYLRQIEKLSSAVEHRLYQSTKNKELLRLLSIEKSLVYFSTSLKANEVTLEKIRRGRILKLYEEDLDLLEDVLVEVRQAIEMTNIYSSILSGTMDAFASVISNNVNATMKTLTALTILVTIPNIVFGFYGMNVDELPFIGTPIFPLAISLAIGAFAFAILKKRDLF